jgi:hypothetical protein
MACSACCCADKHGHEVQPPTIPSLPVSSPAQLVGRTRISHLTPQQAASLLLSQGG